MIDMRKMQVAELEWKSLPMIAAVIDGEVRWEFFRIADVLLAPNGFSVESLTDLICDSIGEDEVFSGTFQSSAGDGVGIFIDYDAIERILKNGEIKERDKFLYWLRKQDALIQKRTMSEGVEYLESYCTPGYAAAIRQTLKVLGYKRVSE